MMKVYIFVKDGKVKDLVSDLINKSTGSGGTDEEYFYWEGHTDVRVGDTWDFKLNTNVKDSIYRDQELYPSKYETETDLKIKELENRILELEKTNLEVNK